MANANNNKLTPAQRAALFGASTRQHYQMLGKQTITGGAQSVSFEIPKARILQSIKLLVTGSVKITGSGQGEMHPLDPFKLFRMVRLDLNNGFAPIVSSGENLAIMSMLSPHPESVFELTTGGDWIADENGGENPFEFYLDIPVTLNERDPVGYILAQNLETNITLNIDIANPSDITNNPALSGCHFEISNMTIEPMVVSFSIPNNPAAFPDMSVLRVVETRKHNFSAGGSTHVKLSTGMIHRKIILKFSDEQGNPLSIEDFTSNFQLVINTADNPYTVSPAMLTMLNHHQLGAFMPDGCFAFDFSYQGISNYGGSRDYIDSETISSFELVFSAGRSGRVEVISEMLSRLI